MQIGWVTLDNVSPNDTFMATLEKELMDQGINFKRSERQIQ